MAVDAAREALRGRLTEIMPKPRAKRPAPGLGSAAAFPRAR
jgi:hypothetical protein